MDSGALARWRELRLRGVSGREAARVVGVAESTIRGWLARESSGGEVPVFRRVVDAGEHVVWPLGDVHIGSRAHREDLWLEWLDALGSGPSQSMLGMGDLLNCGIKTSVSDVHEETLPVGDAKRRLGDQLEPVKHLVDLLIPGNHEARVWKAVGDCPIRDVAERLGVPYAPATAYVVYVVGACEYTFCVRHGRGGGQVGAHANRLARWPAAFEADVYLEGHRHRELSFTEHQFRVVNGRAVRRPLWFCGSGSFLGYERYAAEQGYAPLGFGCPRIRLDGRSWGVSVTTGGRP